MNQLPNMSTSDIADTLKVMRKQEHSYKRHDYISSHRSPKSLKRSQVGCAPVDAECRFKMAEWCYQVVDFCKFSRETVSIAMSYLDRYLATETGRPALDDRKVFQLAAMTCLYTAIKIHEPEAMEPRIVAQLSRGTYTEDEVTAMEMQILNAIQWRMNPPTAMSFINSFFAFLPEGMMSQEQRDAVYEVAKFQTELAVNETTLISVDESTVAFAAVLNAFETIACAGTMEIMSTIAQVSGIDMQSTVVYQTQEKLFQAASGVSSMGAAVGQLAPKAAVPKHMGRGGSVHVSPRSVVSS